MYISVYATWPCQITREKAGLATTFVPTEPWGVIMDWVVSQATATIIAFSNGHASIYLSTGGEFIGGGLPTLILCRKPNTRYDCAAFLPLYTRKNGSREGYMRRFLATAMVFLFVPSPSLEARLGSKKAMYVGGTLTS